MTRAPAICLASVLGVQPALGCARGHAPADPEDAGARAAVDRAPRPRVAHGLWVWKTPAVVSEDPDAAELVSFCARHDISEVYLSTAQDGLGRADLPNFVARLRSSGLAVEALIGEPTWYRPERRRLVIDRIEEIAHYNHDHPEARFSGIHLDIEPHQIPENKGAENRRFLPALVETLAAARDAAAARGLPLSADLSRKLLRASAEEGGDLIAASPRLVLMLYEIDSKQVVAWSRVALGWAAARGTGRVVVAVRANDFGERTGEVLREIDAALGSDPAYGGWAMHDYAAFRSLGAGAP